ncbi:MBL fold metallo-hydrolase [Desmospora profundinema]|uniref:Ribonuclease BN (tRNA processing enzyme) n=1 Tax=Desmospora profundinema TaxID=1571184 RepID=A0ABU1IIN6_9BACL|nr:MBL fold metallo-hydrolase [Desmospora profundinema]MDR6224268.1 ribonuclease BN (tRNA processing enzyme) [Desmospora profundinema]
MKWTVLGCHSPYPGAGGATSGYLLQISGKNILVDCGSGVLAQLGSIIRPDDLDEVWLSHLHHDHIADFFVLQYAVQTSLRLGWRSHPLPVRTPLVPREWGDRLPYHQAVQIQEIKDGDRREEDGWSVYWCRTDHGVPCYAMVIQSKEGTILFGADAGLATDWNQMTEGPDLFICEGTYLHRDKPVAPMAHHSVREAAEAATRIGAHALMITHWFPGYDPKEIEREAQAFFTGRVWVAQSGLSVEIGDQPPLSK